jgi:hypothetical protein
MAIDVARKRAALALRWNRGRASRCACGCGVLLPIRRGKDGRVLKRALRKRYLKNCALAIARAQRLIVNQLGSETRRRAA